MLLDKQILNYVTVGNIVRVSFTDALTHKQKNTAYLRIIKKCKKNPNWFLGVCEDPYYGEEDWFLLKNGDKRAFSIHHITEIPLEWNMNQNLNKHARTFPKKRVLTGAILN